MRTQEGPLGHPLRNIKALLLMGDGPSGVPDSVYSALALPTVGPLDPGFDEILDRLQGQLRNIFNVSDGVCAVLGGPAAVGMETCLVNLLEPGERLLVLDNGMGGERLRETAQRLGLAVDVLTVPWGDPVLSEQVAQRLARSDYHAVVMVHAESSTGVRSPVGAVGDLVSMHGALFIVDCETSLGGMDVDMARWRADALFASSHKCLSCPPGLAPVAFSMRALDRVGRRRTPIPGRYFDIALHLDYWQGAPRVCHLMPSVNLLYALHMALEGVLNEGLPNVFARHRAAHEQLVTGLAALGLRPLADVPWRLPMLHVVPAPEGVDAEDVRGRLRAEHGIEIGGGVGRLAGRVWRIGLMGHSARTTNVVALLEALGRLL